MEWTKTKEETNETALTGRVFDIKRFALHDGPGIRTTVFLKGCPLSCIWCQNPEGISLKPNLWYHKERCIRCERCISSCPHSALSAHPGDDRFIHIDRQKCRLSGACVETCPTGALAWDSKEYGVEELADLLEKDAVFYKNSGGGVTLSGGEPLFQLDFALALLEEAKRRGLHTALESTLSVNRAALERAIPVTDHFLADLKLRDSDAHTKYTGVPNETILENMRFLAEAGVKMTIRLPLIPEITATEENVAGVAAYVASLPGNTPLEFVNFNPLPAGKYHALDIPWPFKEYTSPLSQEEVERLKGIAADQGVTIG